ncbi:acyl-CoA thioesterase [Halorussus caseinilyticus]|uniref:Acyl-CoA thioesterase n=1 Tax=Halorussus caseinilyticus TaxID=3034025 RepID=A0ABD5WM02_9EURY|nr:acyl-CoA thioesterase [Halorussus sp. DT72]
MQHQSARRTATLAESHTETTEILMPDDTNNLGRALGGSVLHWMDICGAIAARRFSRRQVVTASMDHVDFLAPIDLGDVVVTEAYVFETGETSMEAKVDVYAERPSDDEARRETATSFFTFVALDDDEEAASVPDLRCPTAEQKEKRERALEERKERRAELAEQG